MQERESLSFLPFFYFAFFLKYSLRVLGIIRGHLDGSLAILSVEQLSTASFRGDQVSNERLLQSLFFPKRFYVFRSAVSLVIKQGNSILDKFVLLAGQMAGQSPRLTEAHGVRWLRCII